MRRVIQIVRERGTSRRSRSLVVLSACAGVTNALIRTSELALRARPTEALHEIDHLEARHAAIVAELIEPSRTSSTVLRQLHGIWDELRTLVRGVNLLHELTPKSRDQFQSVGERCSTLIFHAALAEELEAEGIPVHFYDAREFFVTSSDYTVARPLVREIEKRMRKIRKELSDGAVGVTQGFIGTTVDDHVTTIGRGGSDFSAAIQGVAIAAKEIQIWTDVAGIMTCDPRMTPKAFTRPEISFSDASQLAFFGAKVLHPETIWPAVEKGIPVLVLSSKEPDAEGSTIRERIEQNDPITGIAIKRNVVLANVRSRSALPDASVQEIVWEQLALQNKVPLAVALSVDSALYVLEDETPIAPIRAALGSIAVLNVQTEKALITLVGPGLKERAGIAARMFKALGRSNCEMISYGGSDTAVSVVVSEDVATAVVRRMHKEFFE